MIHSSKSIFKIQTCITGVIELSVLSSVLKHESDIWMMFACRPTDMFSTSEFGFSESRRSLMLSDHREKPSFKGKATASFFL